MTGHGARQPLWLRLGVAVGGLVALMEIIFAIFVVVRVGTRFGVDPGELLGLAWETALVGAVVLAAQVAVVFLLTRRVSRRLEGIADGARRFSSGDLRHRIPTPRSRELRALTEALNDMAVQLSAQITKLRAQQNELEAILRSMEGGLIAISAEQHILRINRIARKMLELKDEDVRGKRLGDVVSDSTLRRFAADAISDPTRRSDEFEIGSDPRYTVRATSGALLDAEDEPVGAIILLTDVTQLKRLESVRSDFAANVSHELRTPITNIKGYSETLLESGLDGQMSTSFLRVIARNAERLGAIVDDMLALTNLERTDEQTLPTSPTPVEAIVRSVRSQVGSEASARGIRIEEDLAPGLRALVNSRLAEQALANLVSNAVKYSPDDTVVTILARPGVIEKDQHAVELSVIDQGSGIAAEHLPRIFERFYRVDKARSRERGGTGLGLSIVKHIALVHGGQVRVDSKVGVGSTFRLVLPAAEARGPGVALPADTTPDEPPPATDAETPDARKRAG